MTIDVCDEDAECQEPYQDDAGNEIAIFNEHPNAIKSRHWHAGLQTSTDLNKVTACQIRGGSASNVIQPLPHVLHQ